MQSHDFVQSQLLQLQSIVIFFIQVTKINQTQYSENHDKTDPAINIGYRRNVPGKHFLYRTGIGYPEGIYFGVGYAL